MEVTEKSVYSPGEKKERKRHHEVIEMVVSDWFLPISKSISGAAKFKPRTTGNENSQMFIADRQTESSQAY